MRLPINESFTSYLAPFTGYCRLLVKFAMSMEVSLFNAFVLDYSLSSRLQNLTRRRKRHRGIVQRKAYFDTLNHLDVTHECERRAGGQIDMLTDIPVAKARFTTLRGQQSFFYEDKRFHLHRASSVILRFC